MISWIDTGFALTTGTAQIASTAILPILPVFLVMALDGRRWRPLGLLAGFLPGFVIAASGMVIPLPGLVRFVALALLFAYASILTSNRLWQRFDARPRLSRPWQGFRGGIAAGASLGWLWLPVGGDGLLTAVAQAKQAASPSGSVVQLLAFAFGAALPMLALALLVRPARYAAVIETHARGVRKTMGVIMLASLIALAAGANPAGLFGADGSLPLFTDDRLQDGVPAPYPAPELDGIDGWINTPPLSITRLKGKVVLVELWSYADLHSLRLLPKLAEWDKVYRRFGLVVIAVHAPQFPFEALPGNARRAVTAGKWRFPVALDSELKSWGAYHARYWPSGYLIDRDSQMVYTHVGEQSANVTENNIRALLGLKKRRFPTEPAVAYDRDQTPTTAFGHTHAERFDSHETPQPDHVQVYHFPGFLPTDHWALDGPWVMRKDALLSASAPPPVIAPLTAETPSPDLPSGLRFNFTAAKVYLVLGSADGRPIHVATRLNADPVGSLGGKDVKASVLSVDHHRLYEVVDQKQRRNSLLALFPDRPGLEVYAVTFGN